MIGILKAIVELVELRESFLHVPLVVLGLELQVEEDSAWLTLAFGVGRDGDLHRRRQVVVVHRFIISKAPTSNIYHLQQHL